jgi:GTP-binding protein YchF
LRFFDDPNVIHVANRVNPEEDLKILEEELILSDLQTLNKQKPPKMNDSKATKSTYEVAGAAAEQLNLGKPIRSLNLTDEELELLRPLNLLTQKPVIYVANMSEHQLATNYSLLSTNYQPLIKLCAKLESELVDTTDEERKDLLNSVGIKESALDQLAKIAYETLNLISFLTAGKLEARAWSIIKGTSAQDAAGVIHTDFIKKFIKADIVKYADFVKEGGWLNCRQKGLVCSEGKDYIMQEGDVVEFKIGG